MESVKLKSSLTKRLLKFKWVSYPERLQIASKLDVSRPTIDNYINGKVANLVFAEKLLNILGKTLKPKK